MGISSLTAAEPSIGADAAATLGAFFGAFFGAYFAVVLVSTVLGIIVEWRILARGGCPGWAIFIPIYNVYCLCKAIFGRGWTFLLYLIPLVNIILALITPFCMARAYGRNTFFFGLGLMFFPFIFFLILAFGEDRYCGPNN